MRLLALFIFVCAAVHAATPQDLVAQMLPSDLLLPNAAALSLSAEQQDKLREGLTPLQREMPALQQQMQAANTALVALLAEAKPDDAAVLAKYAELEGIESRIKVLRLKMTLVAKSVLTAEQQQRARTLREGPAAANAAGSGETIPAKLQRVRDGLERLKREGRSTSEVRAKWLEFQQHAEAREHPQAMKALDEALGLIEGGQK